MDQQYVEDQKLKPSNRTKRFFAWCGKHKRTIEICSVIVGGVIGAVIGTKIYDNQHKNDSETPALGLDAPAKEFDFGQVFVMKFFDQETGEPYREDGPLCTEDYVKETYDMDGAYGSVKSNEAE